jgi:hypothetical protein
MIMGDSVLNYAIICCILIGDTVKGFRVDIPEMPTDFSATVRDAVMQSKCTNKFEVLI